MGNSAECRIPDFLRSIPDLFISMERSLTSDELAALESLIGKATCLDYCNESKESTQLLRVLGAVYFVLASIFLAME